MSCIIDLYVLLHKKKKHVTTPHDPFSQASTIPRHAITLRLIWIRRSTGDLWAEPNLQAHPGEGPNVPSSREGSKSVPSHVLISIWILRKRYLHYIARSSLTIYAFPWIVRFLFSYHFIKLSDVMMHQPLHSYYTAMQFVDLVASWRWPELNKHYLGWSKTY